MCGTDDNIMAEQRAGEMTCISIREENMVWYL